MQHVNKPSETVASDNWLLIRMRYQGNQIFEGLKHTYLWIGNLGMLCYSFVSSSFAPLVSFGEVPFWGISETIGNLQQHKLKV